jgi:Domain of unknown function (DUF4177)
MGQRYEYKFVRLGEKTNWFVGHIPVEDKDVQSYQDIIRQHGEEGWRLVEIFAPDLAVGGRAAFYELIFEREHPPAA